MANLIKKVTGLFKTVAPPAAIVKNTAKIAVLVAASGVTFYVVSHVVVATAPFILHMVTLMTAMAIVGKIGQRMSAHA